jgi:carbon storage regulator
MLVLTRRVREAIVFPDLGITVRVVHLKGGAIRLGIEAPKGVTVFREELLAVTRPRSTL